VRDILTRQTHGVERRPGLLGSRARRRSGDAAPSGAGSAGPLEREIHVAVTNGTQGAAASTVALDLARRLDVGPGVLRDQLQPRGRVAVGALSRNGSRAGEDRRVHVRATRHVAATGAARFTSGTRR